MRTVDPSEASPDTSAVLLDNTMVSSSARLVGADYDTDDIVALPSASVALLGHDLFSLASLCESIVLCDEIYLNSLFTDVWSGGSDVERDLHELCIGLTMPPDLLDLAAQELEVIDWSTRPTLDHAARQAAYLIESFNHPPPPDSSCRGLALRAERAQVLRVFGEQTSVADEESSSNLYAGTAFYLLASQLLGIPYRPSGLRAEMLRERIGDQITALKMIDPRALLEQALEQGRDAALSGLVDTVRRYFDHSLEFNDIRVILPNVFMAILATCDEPSVVLSRAFDIRDSSGAEELRTTLGDFSWELRAGQLPRAAPLFKSIKRAIGKVNESLGLTTEPGVEIGLQFGPVSMSPLFSLPRLVGRSPRFSRQMLFIREQYGKSIRAGSAEQQVQRVFIRHLPESFRTALRREHLAQDLI